MIFKRAKGVGKIPFNILIVKGVMAFLLKTVKSGRAKLNIYQGKKDATLSQFITYIVIRVA